MKTSLPPKLVAGLLALMPVIGHATTIVQNLSGLSQPLTGYIGESFTTPSDFLYYNLTFNFYSNVPATTPSAAGTAFILNQPYAGSPSALSVGTPGFLAESLSTTNGVYSFNPGFILMTSTTYYLYENASITFSYGGSVAGGNIYDSASPTNNYISSPTQSANFTLNGTRVGTPLVPEPSTWAMCALGAVGAGAMVLRWRQARA